GYLVSVVCRGGAAGLVEAPVAHQTRWGADVLVVQVGRDLRLRAAHRPDADVVELAVPDGARGAVATNLERQPVTSRGERWLHALCDLRPIEIQGQGACRGLVRCRRVVPGIRADTSVGPVIGGH